MGEEPLARSDDLIVEELGDEILVYDTKTDRAHSLSPSAAKVWRASDGNTSAEELSARLGLDDETVMRALDELGTCDLLDVSPTITADGQTRREVSLRLAKVGAAVAAAPLVYSMAAPLPAQARSIKFCAQFSDQNCGSGGCLAQCGCCCCVEAGEKGIKTCVPIQFAGSLCPAGKGCTGGFSC